MKTPKLLATVCVPVNLDLLAWALARIMAEAEEATVEAVDIKEAQT